MEGTLKAILICVSLLPTSIDMWLAVIAICKAFNKKIPTIVWVMLVLELLCLLDIWPKVQDIWKAL